MGQAKQRGSFLYRKEQAIDAGRTKVEKPSAGKLPVFVAPGYKPALVNTLTEVSNQINLDPYWSSQYGSDSYSAKPRAPFHELSDGGERSVADLEAPPDTLPGGLR